MGGVPWEFCSSPFLGGWGRGLMWRESGLPRDQAGVWGASMCEYLWVCVLRVRRHGYMCVCRHERVHV